MLGWIQYTGDNNEKIVNNFGVGATQAEITGQTYRNWVNDVMIGPRVRMSQILMVSGKLLSTLTSEETLPFIGAPADNYVSPAQRFFGWTSRPRSYSMNCYVGPFDPSGAASSFDSAYRKFLKSSSIPRPTDVFVTLDQHPRQYQRRLLPAFFDPGKLPK